MECSIICLSNLKADIMPSSESYLVVGGCGFLGRHIVEQLLERGESRVSVFDIVQRHFDNNVDFYIGDITKAEDVENAIKKSGATCIIHTASPAHGADATLFHLVNVIGTQTVLTAAKSLGVRKLVYTSSGSVVFDGVTECINADERIGYPAVAHDAYNETKAKAEKMVLEANGQDGLLTCAIRPAGIFGPGDRQMITGFYNVVKKNQTRFQIGYNENLSDYTYVGNVAHAHLLAADKLETTYPLVAFRDPLPPINLSLGGHRIPTSSARPLGPNTKPAEADRLAAQKFESGEEDEDDARPVLRNKMDQFNDQANNDDLVDDENAPGLPIAGQAFFITNGEPIYFWDFARTIWKQLGHVPPYIIVIPMSIGLVIATIMEFISKFTGKEPGFTPFRVKQATQMRFYDIERARRLLGYEPQVGVEEGVRRWTEWFKQELEKQPATAAQETEKTK